MGLNALEPLWPGFLLRSEKGKLSGGLALKPAPRATRCSPRQRARSTGYLLEQATEVAHRVHPI
jgi:hypothetical protein